MRKSEGVRIVIADKTKINRERIEVQRILPCYYRRYVEYKNREEAAGELTAGILLYRYLGISDSEQITYGAYGKPHIKNGAYHFNLSHAGKYVVLAIADVPVGIDIEPLDGVKWEAAKIVFPGGWMEKLENAAREEQEMLFTVMWTKTEAVLKAAGAGFWKKPRENQAFLEEWITESLLYDGYVVTYASKYGLKNTMELYPENHLWPDG